MDHIGVGCHQLSDIWDVAACAIGAGRAAPIEVTA
jgi:hypothetical protein